MKEKSDLFSYPVTIKEFHLDTFGHVNNAKYLELYEEARWELITVNGYGLKTCIEKQIGPIILSVELQFKKEMRNREKVVIHSYAYDYVGKISKIKQVIVKENGEEASSAVFTFGLFDMKARKLILPTPEWLKAIGLA